MARYKYEGMPHSKEGGVASIPQSTKGGVTFVPQSKKEAWPP